MKKSSTQNDPINYQPEHKSSFKEETEEFEKIKKEMKEEFSFQIKCICEHYDEQFELYSTDLQTLNDQLRLQYIKIFNQNYDETQVKLYQSILKEEYEKKIKYYNSKLNKFQQKFSDFQQMVEPLFDSYKKVQTNQSDEVIKLIFEYQDKVKDYLSDKKEQSDIIKYLSSQNKQLEETLKQIMSTKNRELSSQKRFQNQIQQENSYLKKSIQSLEVEKINLMAQSQDYLKKSFHFQTELEKKKNLQKNASDLGNISACLKLELNERENQINLLKKNNEGLKTSLDKIQQSLEQQIGNSQKEIELLKSQLKIEIQNRENIVFIKDQEIEKLEKQYQRDIAAQEDRKQDIHKNLMKNEMEYIQLKNKYQDLQEDLENMQTKLEANIQELETEIETQKQKYENDIKLIQEQTFKQVMEVKYENEKALGRIHEEYASKMVHSKTQISSLEKLLKYEEEAVKQKSNQIIEMEVNHKQYVEELCNRIQELNEQLYQQNILITESSLSNSRSIKQIEYIQIENTEHITKIDALKQEIAQLNETVQKQDEIILKNIQTQQDLLLKKEAEYNKQLQKILQNEKQKYYEKITEFVKQHQKSTGSAETQTDFNLDDYIKEQENNFKAQMQKMSTQLKEEYLNKEQKISDEISILQQQVLQQNEELKCSKEENQLLIDNHQKQIIEMNKRHKAETTRIKTDFKKEKNEKFLNQIKKLEQEKQEFQEELEKLKELNTIHYERLMKKLKEDTDKRIFELEQLLKNERHKSHLLKSEQVLAEQKLISQHQQEMQIIKIALNEAQDKLRLKINNLKHSSAQTSQVEVTSSRNQIKQTQTDFNFIQELFLKDKQREMEERMLQFERQQNLERENLIKEQEDYLAKMLKEFKSLRDLFDNKYNNLNDQYQKLLFEYEQRPSRFEDIDLIDKLNKKIELLQKQYKELTMDVQNREQNYNKVFKSNPIVGVYAPLNILKTADNQQNRLNKQSTQFNQFEQQNSASIEFDNQFNSSFQNRFIQSSLANFQEIENSTELFKGNEYDKSLEFEKSKELKKDFKCKDLHNISSEQEKFEGQDPQIENRPNLINLPPKQPRKEMYNLNQPMQSLILSKNQQVNKRYKKNSFDLNKSQESLEDTLKIQQQGINRNISSVQISQEENQQMQKNTSLPSGQLLGEFLDSDLPITFSNESYQITTNNRKSLQMKIIKEDTQETEKTPYRRKNKLVVKGINMKKIDNSQVQYVIESTRSMMMNNNLESNKSSNTNQIPQIISTKSQQSNQNNIFGLSNNLNNSFAQALNRQVRSQNSNYESVNPNSNTGNQINSSKNKINFSLQSASTNMNRCSTAISGQYRTIGNNTSQSISLDRSTLDIEINYSKQMKRKYLNSSLDLPSTTSNDRYFDKLFSVSKSSNEKQNLNLNSSTNASLISGQQNQQINKYLESIQVNDLLSTSHQVAPQQSSTVKNSFKSKQIPLNKLYKTITNQ